MKKELRSVLNRVSHALDFCGRHIYQSEQEKRVVPWFRDHGDTTLRLNYNLTEQSLVIDLGGYNGQWASDIFSKYCCRIFIFEPVIPFADNIRKRFEKNHNIYVYNYGLSGKTCRTSLSLSKSDSSVYKKNGNLIEIELVKAMDFFNKNGVSQVDLMKINIEGGEYDLLENLIEEGFICKVENIQVQFHDFVPEANRRMTTIQKELTKTHTLSYQYPFVWENWILNL